MSDPRHQGGLMSAVAGPIAEELKQHQALPPNKQAANRAYFGTFMLSGCAYLALLDPDAASYATDFKIGLAVAGGLGLLLLVVGWRGARGARDPVGALFAVAVPVGGFLAVLNYAPDMLDDFYVRGFCVAIACANIVRFALAIRGPGGDAQKIVHRQIAQNEINWQGVKRRR
jgi:hypothetical protein